MSHPIEIPRFLQLDWGAPADVVTAALTDRGFTDVAARSRPEIPGSVVEGRGVWLDWHIHIMCAFDRGGTGRGLEQVQTVMLVQDGHPKTALEISNQVMNRLLKKYDRYTWDYMTLLKDAGHLGDQRCFRWCHPELTGGADIFLTLMEGSASRPPLVVLTYRSPSFAQQETQLASPDDVISVAMAHVPRILPPQSLLAVQRDESGEWYCFGIAPFVMDEPEALADVVISLAMRGIHFGVRHPEQARDLLEDARPLRGDEVVDWSESEGPEGKGEAKG